MQIAILRKYDVKCFPDADARAQARVGPGVATPLWESGARWQQRTLNSVCISTYFKPYSSDDYDVKCFPDALDVRAQARVGPGVATPLWESGQQRTLNSVSPLTSNLTVQMISLICTGCGCQQ